MASKLHNVTRTYGRARVMEMSEAYSTSPTRLGTSSNGTWTDNSANSAVAGYISTDGPAGGAGCWEFETTTSTTTQEYFLVTSSIETTEGTELADEDWGLGFWFKIVGEIPDTTSVNAIRLFTATPTGVGVTVQVRGKQASTNASELSVTAGSTVYSGSVLTTGVWHYFAVRRVGSTGSNMFAYLDGTQFANWSNTTTTGTLTAYGFNQTTANTATATWRVSNLHVGSSTQLDAAAISNIWSIGNTTPSSLEKEIGKYAVERSIEMSDTPDTTPQITGSSAYGTYATFNSVALNTSDGPLGGNDSWDFPVTTSSATAARYTLSNANDFDTFSDEDYTLGFWLKFPNVIPGSNPEAYNIIQVPATNGNGFDITLTGSSNTNAPGTGTKLVLRNFGVATSVVYSPVLTANTWYYVAIRRTGSSGTNYSWYLNGSLISSFSNTSVGTASGQIIIGAWQNPGTSGLFRMSNLHWASSATLTPTEIGLIHTAGASSPATNINYTDTSGAIASADIPMPTHTAETVINVIYTSDVLGTASALLVDPAISINTNLDGFGVAEASALAVDPVITTTRSVNYSADPSTTSATSPNATVAAQKFVNVSADPATASVLLSSNVFYGESIQDTSYVLQIRSIASANSNNTSGNSGFIIGTQSDGNPDVITNREAVAIKANNGFPAYNKLIKAKINSAHVTATTLGGDLNANTFNVYVLTADPTSGTFTTAPYSSFTPVREYLYTTRLLDDSSSNQQYLDLTPAFADSRAASYGIMIEHVHTETSSIGTVYDRTEFTGTNLNNQLLYVLSSDIINKNINADIITASGTFVDPTVDAQKFVNVEDGVATVSALIVQPSVGLSVGYISDPSNASALVVQPTFSRTVEYPHAHAEAFGAMPNVQVFAFGTVTYNASVMTASALFHDPQTQIGENNTVASMDGSALFVDPMLLLSRSVAAMTTTASTLMVDPAVSTQLLGAITASPMIAGAMSPNPPAYLNLFSDRWYSTLYAQHSVRHGLPTGFGGAFLKLFEDQNTDITQSTPNTAQSQDVFNGEPTLRQLRNNVTWGIANNTGPENDIRKVVATAITDYSSASNESRMSVGYFDNWNRKAIRLQNIGFRAKSGLSSSKSDFSMEFSIKTTKANQIISYGEWSSPTSSSSVKTTYNLVNGRVNYMTYNAFEVLHPNSVKPYSESSWAQRFRGQLTGNKQINDGQWHHVVIQFVEGPEMDGIAGRFQIWIDGELDIQRFDQQVYDPDFMGSNIEDATFAPDFYTSVWSIDAPGTVSERDIDLHYFDFIKYQPILAEPMTASLTMTSENSGRGNRGRALMLYWWPTSSGQNKNFITSRFDSPTYSGGGEFDINMSAQELETIDFIGNPPQQYYGWDVFPVDVNGYFVSDLVKEQAYGGAQNIIETDLGGGVDVFGGPRPKFKANRRGYFRNTIDDTRRYIDLVNDIDLSQFDAIFFKNYPDQSNEVDAFAKNEIVDPYFNIRETRIYEDFIKSLRAAVDTGISLMVNNPQLALDLKIIDRIEVVPDLTDGTGYYSDPYTPTLLPTDAAGLTVGTGSTTNIWTDTYRNNRLKVLNTLDRLTNYRTLTYVDAAYWNNDDTLNYGGPSKPFRGYQYKENGLAVGDEFFISTFYFGNVPNGGGSIPKNYLATPIQNIKAGTPITAFANQYRQGTNLIDNPYKDYVTSIAIKPGDVLDGRQVGGKIWVNFTDPISQENEYVTIDSIHTDWINRAYNEGSITLEKRNQLLAQPDLLETQLSQGRITQSEYNKLSRWHSNGMYILTQTEPINEEVVSKPSREGVPEKVLSRKFNKDGVPSTQVTYVTGPQFFSFKYARKYEQLTFAADSMNTRGLRWLSSRVAAVGQNQAHTAMPASAAMVQPTIIAVRDVSENAPAMIANAIHLDPVGFAGANRNILSLPMAATALITQPVRIVSAAPMTATANTRQDIVIRTTAQDQVVVYVLHEDPILYLREDIIK